MMSLRKISSSAVIKYGIAWDELPWPLNEELKAMEELIKSDLTGQFSYTEMSHASKLKIGWDAGEWRFSFLNQQPVQIRAGERQCLGMAGGELFLFENREISIDDFTIDLEERKITFYGVCSSVKNSDGREFKSTIRFTKFHSMEAMKMNSEVIGDDGKIKARERIYSKAGYVWITLNLGQGDGSDSDSSVDYGSDSDSSVDYGSDSDSNVDNYESDLDFSDTSVDYESALESIVDNYETDSNMSYESALDSSEGN
eukprot:GFUD01040864.1.p1 GENE.GFUD01040864.1~~GFUD01040864.1.p1  ORF type:complete len:256 (-),score=76.00 GFUD01040864.1:49-816(-)